MNKLNINVIALAIGLMFSAGAMAEGLSKEDYKAGKEKIAADYKLAKTGCDSLSGNTKDICVVDAKGKEKVARAELEASLKPSRKATYKTRVAQAEAEYAVAKEKCDDAAGNAKDVCVKEAKAGLTTAKADAKAKFKTKEARAEAKEKSADARKDAASDKTDAQYAVAKEKCDTYADAAKVRCNDEAKAKFGK